MRKDTRRLNAARNYIDEDIAHEMDATMIQRCWRICASFMALVDAALTEPTTHEGAIQ
jgi:hypothetical protein